MDVNHIIEKIKEAREASKTRNFTQTFDLVINLKQLDLKKPEHKVDVAVPIISQVKAKKYKICAIVDHSVSEASDVFDKVVYNDELQAMKGDMEKIRTLTHGFDKFVVQANFMPLFAQILGRYLGPMNKMPSPKLGMVISAKTPLAPLYEKLQKTVHLQTKKNLVLQVSVGAESVSDETLAKDIHHIYEVLLHALPNHEHNIKDVGIKLTMGKLVVL